jgi:hypothetical protein
MRELADKLYLTRREFLKGLVAVGAGLCMPAEVY